jgi:NDP-sugar pyrophosphorylase family protein
MKASLLILAAGMGSRYGSLKQMDAFGPSGETIIDYSIYDAIQAGFEKIVFVVRKSFRKEIETHFRSRIGNRVEMVFVDQELDKIPSGYDIHPERSKPWGTAHAVMMGAEAIDGPFAVINADDYYGPSSYKELIKFFKALNGKSEFAVVAYFLENTLSEHGSVNRGVCYQNSSGYLDKIVETLKISTSDEGRIVYPLEDDKFGELAPRTLVSMNMFGFTPAFFQYADSSFRSFLKERGMELKSEFFIPLVLDQMINDGSIGVKVLTSEDKWFGVTYKEDKPVVIQKINQLIEQGIYPSNLWA